MNWQVMFFYQMLVKTQLILVWSPKNSGSKSTLKLSIWALFDPGSALIFPGEYQKKFDRSLSFELIWSQFDPTWWIKPLVIINIFCSKVLSHALFSKLSFSIFTFGLWQMFGNFGKNKEIFMTIDIFIIAIALLSYSIFANFALYWAARKFSEELRKLPALGSETSNCCCV